jgi:ABC-type siderophore export system fused ATPase/permease subunit
MLTYEVSFNIYTIAILVGLSVLAGFSLRAKMIMKYRTKIEELEREILNNYEHILELEREGLHIESRLQDLKSPVITMKATNIEPEVSTKKVPDISLRKELLSKKNIGKQSASGL